MQKVKIKQRLTKKQKTCPPSEDRPRDALCRLKPCKLRAGYRLGFAAHLQSAPMKNNLLEKLTYFSNDIPDLSQTYRHHMWVCKQHVCAKFDHSSFNRSRDIWLVPTKLLIVHVPFRDVFIILGLELATVNLPTKLEVFISTHYEDMTGDSNCGK